MNRKQFFDLLRGTSAGDLQQIQTAYWLGKNGHRLEVRSSGERYFEHVRDVAVYLIEHRLADTDVIVRALLHDAIENTNTPMEVYVNLFGHETWEDLFILSKKIPIFDPVTGQIYGTFKKPNDEYYKGVATGSRRVRLVKLSDRRHNMTTMMAGGWSAEKQADYARETEEFLLPIAHNTDPGLTAELTRLVNGVLRP
jgi:(p)ppGpp synthase/HD superfamily hydrolase